MKWRKRLLLAALFLAIFAGTMALATWWLAHGSPEWYAPRKLAPQEVEAAADRAERQFERTLSWAQDRQAESLRGQTQPVASTQSVQGLEIAFTQDELNGFFQKWDATFGWSGRYSGYITDPEIVLRDGRLILAATVNDLGAVLSVELQPRLEEGKLYLPVTRVLAGRLPLPQSFWDRYRSQVEARVARSLPDWQRNAELSPRGGANPDAVAAAMGELLLGALRGGPATPLLFLPYSMRKNPKSLPVKLTGVQIANETLTLTIEPMDAGQCQAVLDAVRHFKPTQIEGGTASD